MSEDNGAPETGEMERRAIPVETAEMRLHDGEGGPKLEGYGAVFDRRSVPLPGRDGREFVEVIRSGAFDGTLEPENDIIAAFNHDPATVFARQSNGRLTLETDERGVKYTAQLNTEDPDAKRVYEKVRDGNVKGSSFTFAVAEDGDDWRQEDGQWVREIHDIQRVGEMGPVVGAAYPDTVVSARTERRALEAMEGSEMPEARASRPTFDGTEDIVPGWVEEGRWGRPDLTDHPEASEGEEFPDLDEADQDAIRGRFIEQEGDTYADLGNPVVNPATGRLNRNGVLAARQRPASDAAEEIADALWEQFYEQEESGRSLTVELSLPDLSGYIAGFKRAIGRRAEEVRQSISDTQDLLWDALRDAFGGEDIYVWIEDLFPEEGELVFHRDGPEDSGLFRVSYEIDDEGSVSLGEPEPVRRVTTYETIPEDDGRSADLERMRRWQRQREAEAGLR